MLGGYTEYNFPDIAKPGETISIPIQLQAPDTVGNFTGSWMMKSRSGYTFGVGQYNVPITVSIDVRNEKDIEYGITSVENYMTRDPQFACPANVIRTIHTSISVSGPMKIRYRFYHRKFNGDMTYMNKYWLEFTEAGTKTITDSWPLNRCTNNRPRYWGLQILDGPPTGVDAVIYTYPEFEFINECPDECP